MQHLLLVRLLDGEDVVPELVEECRQLPRAVASVPAHEQQAPDGLCVGHALGAASRWSGRSFLVCSPAGAKVIHCEVIGRHYGGGLLVVGSPASVYVILRVRMAGVDSQSSPRARTNGGCSFAGTWNSQMAHYPQSTISSSDSAEAAGAAGWLPKRSLLPQKPLARAGRLPRKSPLPQQGGCALGVCLRLFVEGLEQQKVGHLRDEAPFTHQLHCNIWGRVVRYHAVCSSARAGAMGPCGTTR